MRIMRKPNCQERREKCRERVGCANWFAKRRIEGENIAVRPKAKEVRQLKWTLAGDLPRTGRNAEAVEARGSAGTLRS
jgi:hypothetical protein